MVEHITFPNIVVKFANNVTFQLIRNKGRRLLLTTNRMMHASKTTLVSVRKGSRICFSGFCPSHGHCYGYHVIPVVGGRKDPAASLQYLEEAPGIIFYDFACSLSEYTHNRESGYFKKTRF